jgi:hypothetical protein
LLLRLGLCFHANEGHNMPKIAKKRSRQIFIERQRGEDARCLSHYNNMSAEQPLGVIFGGRPIRPLLQRLDDATMVSPRSDENRQVGAARGNPHEFTWEVDHRSAERRAVLLCKDRCLAVAMTPPAARDEVITVRKYLLVIVGIYRSDQLIADRRGACEDVVAGSSVERVLD